MVVRIQKKRAPRRRRPRGYGGPLFISAAIIVAAILARRSSTTVGAESLGSPIVAAYDAVTVPVPTKFIPAGTALREVEFRLQSLPRHQVPEGSIEDIGPFRESVALVGLPANVPLFAGNLTRSGGASNAVIDRIPPGMRAMTLKVDATSAVEGWAGAGAFVDILLVTKEGTTVVAEQVKVLSTERSVVALDEGAPQVPSTVTVLVSQEQCLALNTAVNLGKIAFALRSGLDEGSWRTPSYRANRLRGAGSGKESDLKNGVQGYISVKREKGELEAYALSNGQWIRSDVRPDGFFESKSSQELDRAKAQPH